MISADYCRTMARYNAWQNGSLLSSSETLTDAQRREDRGAWFGSVHGTLSHLLWGDLIWMHRLAGSAPPPPVAGIGETAALFPDWADLRARRAAADRAICDWAAGLGEGDLGGDLTWRSAVLQRDVVRPRALCVVHLFNHQTHHRGQVHALLTGLGARPGDTDLPFMPDAV